MPPEVRLQDVADAAGVSIATASRALTGRSRTSAETIAHVLATAERLGYRVNPIGRALREGSTRTVGMVVPVIGNPFFSQMVHAVEAELQAHGLELIIADSHGDVTHEARRLRVLVGRRMDGLIVVPSDLARSARGIEYAARSAPVVQLDRFVEALTTDFVGVDNYLGMTLVVDHLVARGARSVALAGADDVTSAGRERLEAFEKVTARRGLDVQAPILDVFSLESGDRAARELAGWSTLPDAVVAGDDLIAVGLVTAFKRMGISVPGDVLVTGFDGTILAEISDPPLTTVAQPFNELARAAVQALLDRVTNRDGLTMHCRIAPELVVRESTTR
jgi:LacI family transcriptional regulator